MKCVCVDDEPIFWEQIRMVAARCMNYTNIQIDLYFYEKPEALLFDLDEERFYDLYLLDIEFGGDVNGLELAGEIRKRDEDAQIIFLTSHSEFALQGYDYHPFQYVLKEEIGRMENILEELSYSLTRENEQYRVIARKHGIEKIEFQEICYIYKKGKNSVYVCGDGRICSERKSLAQVREEICIPQMLAVGKSYIANLGRIKRLDRQDIFFDREVDPVHISRQQTEPVKRALFDYLKGAAL